MIKVEKNEMLDKSISKNQENDFISFAKTGKTDKLQKAIEMGIDLLVHDAKAFILSARFGQLESLALLVNHLKSIEKKNILRHCFLEACSNNQREIIDYLLTNHFEDLEAEGMEEIALKSCMIGNHPDLLLYVCAKYEFNINLNKDILDWAIKNDYKESYEKLELVLLNKTLKEKQTKKIKNKENIKL